MNFDLGNFFSEACSVASDMVISSVSDALWTGIRYLWPWYWILIVLALGSWVAWEIMTRNGTSHYNSKNGYSPLFNSFVGSVTYWGLQTVTFLLLTLFLGPYVYCLKWPIALHLLIYIGSGRFLNLIGFWVYQKDPTKPRKRKPRRSY